MGLALEIKGGPMAGKVIAVTTGQRVTVGRASGRAEVALPQDTFMSGLHFAVECGTSGCRVVDRQSSNGTFLNGARIQDAMLANGDEIKAGQSVFAVRILSDEKLASLVSSHSAAAPPAQQSAPPSSPDAGRASVEAPSARPSEPASSPPRRTDERSPQNAPAAPGVKSDLPSRPPAGREPLTAPRPTPEPALPVPTTRPAAVNAAAAASSEGPRASSATGAPEGGAAKGSHFAASIMGWSFPVLPAKWQLQEGLGLQSEGGEFPSSVAAAQESLGGITLQQFVEFQINMLKGYLRGAKVEPVVPPRIAGAEETMVVDVRHSTKDGKELVYRRIYARCGGAVGVLTVTALASEMARVLESLAQALNGVEFHKAS